VRNQRITATLGPWFQTLELYNAEISKRVLSGPVTIKGRILARFYQRGQATTLRPSGRTDIPGLGSCLTSADIFECDSAELTPREMPMDGGVLLRRGMGTGISLSHYPQETWLSPLHKLIVFSPQRATTTIAPTTSLGNSLIDYTFPNVDLNQYIVREVRQ
jgi:hypothetical protein